MEGRREEFAGLLRIQFCQIHLRTDCGSLPIAGGHRSYPASSGNGPADGHRCERIGIESFHLSPFADNVQGRPVTNGLLSAPGSRRPAMPEPAKQEASKPLTVDERVGLDKFEFDE